MTMEVSCKYFYDTESKCMYLMYVTFSGRLRPKSWKDVDQKSSHDPHQSLKSGGPCAVCGVSQKR